MGHIGNMGTVRTRDVQIPSGAVTLDGELNVPLGATGIVLFAHGSGSSRHSPRNQFVARVIREAGVGTLLFDLLTREEEAVDMRTRHLRFDIGLLAGRLIDATAWTARESETWNLGVGYFGSSTGAAAALIAAAEIKDEIDERVRAVVSRGERPDLAGAALSRVNAPTMSSVGGRDEGVIELNETAYAQLRCEKELRLVEGATHLFEEPGALEEVARLAAGWFRRHLQSQTNAAVG